MEKTIAEDLRKKELYRFGENMLRVYAPLR